MTKRAILPAAAVAMLAFAPDARADRRYYGTTYDATTSPPGGVDLELWTTFAQPPRAGGSPQYWYHQIELETGITSRWDVALYNDFIYEQSDVTRYAATRVETRYRLSDYGQWFLDPVLYFEMRKEWVADKPFAAEGMLILAKDVERLNVSLNAGYEIEFIPAGGTEHELFYAVGTSYEIVPWVRVGGEAFGGWTRTVEGPTLSTHYAGPALSFATGRNWLVVAAGFGLTDESARMQLRAILAFQF